MTRAGQCAMAVMAKAPRPNHVKTRLVPPLTPQQATSLTASFLRDITENIREAGRTVPLADFKAMVRDQFFMLLIDPEAAVAAIPALLPKDVDTRRKAFALLREVLSAAGAIDGEVAERLREAAAWFGVDPARALAEEIAVPPKETKIGAAKAS